MLTKRMYSLLIATIVVFIGTQACQFGKKDKPDNTDQNLTPGVDGVHYNRNSDGVLVSTMEHKNGKRHGLLRTFYEDGKTIEKEIRYIKNKKEGFTKAYYRSGRLKYIVNYKNDKRDGIMKKYYETGILSSEIPYIDGEPQVGLIEYDPNGKKKNILPEIVVEKIDKTKSEKKYIVRFKLSNNRKSVKFKRILFNKDGQVEGESIIPTENGVGELVFELPKGGAINQYIKVRGVYITSLRNPHVMWTELTVEAEF